MIPTDRDCGLAEWINNIKLEFSQNNLLWQMKGVAESIWPSQAPRVSL